MAFCRFVLPLLVLSVVNALNTPVFIWGDVPNTALKISPLSLMLAEEFSDIIRQDITGKAVTLVFVEDTLSPEDFSHKNAEGNTPFAYLHENVPKSVYLPSVENSLEVLDLIAGEAKRIKVQEEGLSEDINTKVADGSYIFFDLEDALEDETREEFLKRHDEFIRDTVEKFQKAKKDVVGIYTGRTPSWIPAEKHSRVRRAVKAGTYAINGLLLNAKTITLTSGSDTAVLSSLSNSNVDRNGTYLNAKLVFENETSLTLQFNMKGGYWFFNSVILSTGTFVEELKPKSEPIFAIDGFSYRCGQSISFSTVNETRTYTLDFQNLKIQPFFTDVNATQTFGDSFDCVGFFTAPIWSGLFVVLIMLLITFYGIMMMLDIRTMDRFDDPKGKTITINAGE